MKKIIIAGYGFVGKAVANAINSGAEICIVDPKVNDNRIENFRYADGIIICVGTPSDIIGDCDISQIVSVLDETPVDMPVLIKSTVPPDYLEKLLKKYNQHNICYSPEFLRAATADEDFANQEYMVLGGEEPNSIWTNLFFSCLKNLITVRYCTLTEASMVKYSTNCFLSVKVAFFNQLYDMCQINGADYNTVIELLKMDDRMGYSHMQVPGHDGSRGFGGACFPKDTNAFVNYADRINQSHSLVESAIEYNKKVRKSY